MRFGDWKAVRNGPGKPIELYELKSDVAETKNVAAEHPDLVAKAEGIMKSSHVDDPHWPMVKNQKERVAERTRLGAADPLKRQ